METVNVMLRYPEASCSFSDAARCFGVPQHDVPPEFYSYSCPSWIILLPPSFGRWRIRFDHRFAAIPADRIYTMTPVGLIEFGNCRIAMCTADHSAAVESIQNSNAECHSADQKPQAKGHRYPSRPWRGPPHDKTERSAVKDTPRKQREEENADRTKLHPLIRVRKFVERLVRHSFCSPAHGLYPHVYFAASVTGATAGVAPRDDTSCSHRCTNSSSDMVGPLSVPGYLRTATERLAASCSPMTTL